ncbi:RimK/LysX family protein [Hyphomicrobium sp. LHD-15]|uniref:ATP-dependent zinc protease family protein n=1 Tax=Hyphomicrobium sp. LHD-15 TaxID=3072142 RepID=UPI00281022B5|nr:RimK/LysX family protein [Hyphomicrobium sp. LHD-15]MDQ8698976.1 RimK/LysX family protein [Hyphomicrobium sp. LHD-15]
MKPGLKPLILGRREWVALPDLGIFAIKAKVDTGARTSALHAEAIEVFGPATAPRVRFLIHPLPEQPDLSVWCEAELLGTREVTCSNGERDTRHVISTRLSVGDREWPIELGLTDRGGLANRMLLGRQAIRPGMLVDPAHSFLLPRLSTRLYRAPA